jgi:hypothetical protein
MPMIWKEIPLREAQELRFPDGTVAIIEAEEYRSGRDDLRIRFRTAGELFLRSAVDISQQITYQRVFAIEGNDPSLMLLFGGVVGYYVSSDGKEARELSTYRTRGHEEYWQTKILPCGELLIMIYEAGVLAIDGSLRPLWHKRKYFNDVFAGFENGELKLIRDQPVTICIRISDGETSGAPDARSPDDLRSK